MHPAIAALIFIGETIISFGILSVLNAAAYYIRSKAQNLFDDDDDYDN